MSVYRTRVPFPPGPSRSSHEPQLARMRRNPGFNAPSCSLVVRHVAAFTPASPTDVSSMTMAYDRSPATGARTSARDHVLRPRLAATSLRVTYGTNSSYLSRSHTAPHIDALSTSSSTHVARISRTPGLAPALAGAGLDRSSMPSRVFFTNVHSESSSGALDSLARVAAPARTSTRARSTPRPRARSRVLSSASRVDVAMLAIYNALSRKRSPTRARRRRLASPPSRAPPSRPRIAREKISVVHPPRARSRPRVVRVAAPRGALPRSTGRDSTARGRFRVLSRARRRTRARATFETSTRAKSDSKRCRAPFCGDARAARGARRSKRARDARCAIEARRRGIGRAIGERDAGARATRVRSREGVGHVVWNAGRRVAAREAVGERARRRRRDGRAPIGAWGYPAEGRVERRADGREARGDDANARRVRRARDRGARGRATDEDATVSMRIRRSGCGR